MNFLDTQRCDEWCRQRGLPVRAAVWDDDRYEALRFRIPSDAGARVALCRLLWESMDDGAAARLLWITDWSVWASGEHMPLFTLLRAAAGESRPLIDVPGHLVAPGEDDEGLSVLVVVALFLWDCYVYSEAGTIVTMSNDEFGEVWQLKSNTTDISSTLERFGVLAP